MWHAVRQVPCEPKLLVTPLDPQQLARFRLTSLERDPKRDLVLGPDLGIPLSVFDIGRYDVPAVPPPLAPEDAALLEVHLSDLPSCWPLPSEPIVAASPCV